MPFKWQGGILMKCYEKVFFCLDTSMPIFWQCCSSEISKSNEMALLACHAAAPPYAMEHNQEFASHLWHLALTTLVKQTKAGNLSAVAFEQRCLWYSLLFTCLIRRLIFDWCLWFSCPGPIHLYILSSECIHLLYSETTEQMQMCYPLVAQSTGVYM